WEPKVRMAKDFSHSGDASIAVCPTASTGEEGWAMNAATSCPTPSATAATRMPMRPPSVRRRPRGAPRSGVVLRWRCRVRRLMPAFQLVGSPVAAYAPPLSGTRLCQRGAGRRDHVLDRPDERWVFGD